MEILPLLVPQFLVDTPEWAALKLLRKEAVIKRKKGIAIAE